MDWARLGAEERQADVPGGGAMKRKAMGAVLAQAAQSIAALGLQILVARLLGIEEYGRFAILYGVVVVATAVVTGLVGDSLVVLERSDRSIRAGLEIMLMATVAVVAVVAGVLTGATGFGSGSESVLFAVALAAFVTEEIVRRLLMAHMAFPRVMAADLSGFFVVLIVVLSAQAMGALSLGVVLVSLAVGQSVACLVGWSLVPAEDRWFADLRGAQWSRVFRYGAWRGLQQVLRPSLFTIVRLIVLAAAGVAAVGFLEAARTYTSPLILMISGLSSFLFVRFAHQSKAGANHSLREADRVVVLLLAATMVMSVVAIVLIPWVSPLAFGVRVDAVSVVAWLAYGMSVAFVTPYGALGAVAGKQMAVFAIRLGDTVLAVLTALLMLRLGCPASSVPFGLAVASMLGGLGLRVLVSSTRASEPAQAMA